ncbi:MAG: hypothetical protein KDC95_11305 [Planctomycetes bacterium]|nr:hypothetical protein [Planctomycetota bacterium]
MPCECAARRRATFVLLPALQSETEWEGDGDGDDERFTRLLREVKSGVLERSFVDEDAARELSREARRMHVEVTKGRLARADRLATGLVDRVVDLPQRPAPLRMVLDDHSVLRPLVVVLVTAVLGFVLLGSLLFALFATT